MHHKTFIGFAVGIAIAAAVIGFGLVGVAIGHVLWSDASLSLLQHPMFEAGKDLLVASMLAGVLTLPAWFQTRK